MTVSRSLLARALAVTALTLAMAMVSARTLFSQAPPAGRDTTWLERARREAAAILHVEPATVRLEVQWASAGEPAPGAPLQLNGPASGAHWTLTTATRGRAPAPWRAELRIGVEELAPVATRRLPRGTVLAASDIGVARVVTWGPPSPAGAKVATGWVTRRVVLENEILREPAVAPAPLVAPGQLVQFVLKQQGLRLTLQGQATSAGTLGERVAVRLGAGRRLEGIVTGAGEVTAPDSPRTS